MKDLNNKKLVVTVFGGSGFLGSHVSDFLSDKGYIVRIFDQQYSPWLRKDQEMIVGDLLDIDSVFEAVKGSDVVYNFAAISDLDDALDRPLKTVSINILGNTHILEACREYKIKRFIYASTVYVYSSEGGFYRCSKQASEHLVEEYQRTYGLDYTILRYGSIYGPRSDEHNGLFRVIKKALEDRVVSYNGHPDSIREYIHVDDVSRASVHVLNKEFANENVVLTGQESMRVHDILHMLAEIMGIPDKVEFVNSCYEGHYIRTPYSYQPKIGRKYVSSFHVDLGQGLLQMLDEVRRYVKK